MITRTESKQIVTDLESLTGIPIRLTPVYNGKTVSVFKVEPRDKMWPYKKDLLGKFKQLSGILKKYAARSSFSMAYHELETGAHVIEIYRWERKA